MAFYLLFLCVGFLVSATGNKTDNLCKGEPGCISPVEGTTDKYIVRDPVDDIQPPEDELLSFVDNLSVVVTVIIRIIKVMAVLNFVFLFLWITLFTVYQALGFNKETEQLPV